MDKGEFTRDTSKIGDKQPRTKTLVYPYHLDIIGKTNIPKSQIDLEHTARYIEYRRQWETNPKDKIISNFPLHLNIEVTGRCNLMCKHCYRYSRRTDIGDMDFDLFKKIIDEGKKHGLYAVNLSWMGEPFLHPKIIDMMSYAKSKGILDVIINTNGILVDEKMSEKILDSKALDTIIFSLDSITEETHNRVKFGSDFRLVNKNIHFLIDLKEKKGLAKPTIIVQMIDQKQSHEELMSFIYYWRTRADKIRIATYHSPDGRSNDKRRSQNAPEVIFPCPQLWQRLSIAWDGTIYPCIGDNSCREPLGNIKEISIHEVWKSDKLNHFRKKHSEFEADDLDLCSHCDLNKVPKIVNSYGKSINEEEN